jgi:hypothetical protein
MLRGAPLTEFARGDQQERVDADEGTVERIGLAVVGLALIELTAGAQRAQVSEKTSRAILEKEGGKV